jgi:hypothetical protein
VIERIRSGRLSLCAVSRVADQVLKYNRSDLLDQVEGMTLDVIDAMVAELRNPGNPVRERVQAVAVREPVNVVPTPPFNLQNGGSSSERNTDAARPELTGPTAPSRAAEPVESAGLQDNLQNGGPACEVSHTRCVFKVQFGLNEAQMQQFRRAQALASQKAGRTLDLPAVIGLLCEGYLERHDPIRRAERRASRKLRPRGSAEKTVASEGEANDASSAGRAPGGGMPGRSPDEVGSKHGGANGCSQGTRPSRYIPQGVRDAVHVRDGGRCAFVDRHGRRCTETRYLHIDHIQPFARGGSHDPHNLRLLCSAHNQLMAARVFGDAKERRTAKSPSQAAE